MKWNKIPNCDEAPFLVHNFMKSSAAMTLQFTDSGLSGGKDILVAFFLAVANPGVQVHGVVWIDTYSHEKPTATIRTDAGIRLDDQIKIEIQNLAIALQPKLIL